MSRVQPQKVVWREARKCRGNIGKINVPVVQGRDKSLPLGLAQGYSTVGTEIVTTSRIE